MEDGRKPKIEKVNKNLYGIIVFLFLLFTYFCFQKVFKNSIDRPENIRRDYFDIPIGITTSKSQPIPNKIHSNVLGSCESVVNDLKMLSCFNSDEAFDVKSCSCAHKRTLSHQALYILKETSFSSLSQRKLEKETVFVFIHINKAGGTTIKRDLLQRVSMRYGWDGAAFGSFRTWKLLSKFKKQNLIGNREIEYIAKESDLEESRYLSCGKAVKDSKALDYLNKAHCPFRLACGALGLGLCDIFKAKSCMYLTVLRNPLDRLISSYNYVCVQGAENQKKWPKAWKREDYCPLNITEFFGIEVDRSKAVFIANPNLMVERLSKGCTFTNDCADKAVKIAKENLDNKCVRYLILEKFEDGLKKLKRNFGSVFDLEINELLKTKDHRNESPHHKRVKQQLETPGVIEALKKVLKPDIELYEYALAKYESNWEQPIKSC